MIYCVVIENHTEIRVLSPYADKLQLYTADVSQHDPDVHVQT